MSFLDSCHFMALVCVMREHIYSINKQANRSASLNWANPLHSASEDGCQYKSNL